jgi:hypothetical protein
MSLIKGMLTKNPMKRVLKLSQIKSNEYFKDFNWDSLLSFNLEPCYIVQMPQENLKEIGNYSDYIKDNLKDYKPEKDVKPDLKYKEELEVWFNKI